MEKNLKSKIFSIIMLSLIILNIICIESYANTSYTIRGYALDKDGNGIQGINVKDENTNNSTTTDSTGYYQVNTNNKSKIIFEYNESSYKIEDIKKKEYKNYDEKLELAYVYKDASEAEERLTKVEELTKSIVKGAYRGFKNTYNNASDFEISIKNLKNDVSKSSDKSFWKMGLKNWECVTLLLFDNNKENVKQYFKNKTYTWKDRDLYKLAIEKNSVRADSMFDEVYKVLKEEDPKEESIKDEGSLERGKVKTKEFNLNYTTIINAVFEKISNTNTDENVDNTENNENNNVDINNHNDIETYNEDDAKDFIVGKIQAKDIEGNEVAIDRTKVQVNLVKVGTNEKKTINLNNNNVYSINYPKDEGTYKIEYIFYANDKESINGEYYDVTSGYRSITNPTNNIETNVTKTVENNSKNLGTINNDIEENELEDGKHTKCRLILETETFDVEKKKDDGTYPTRKMKGGVLLEYRPRFVLKVEEEINNIVLTLSNGQNIINWTGNDRGKSDISYVSSMTDPSFRTVRIELNDQLLYGSTLFIGYKITVKNESSIDCKEFKILNYYEGFEYNENLKNKGDTSISNKEYNWVAIEKSEAKNYNSKVDDSNEHIKNGKFLLCTGKIAGGETKEIYLAFSRVMRNEDDAYFANETEIVEYRNDEGRRNYSSINKDGKILKVGNHNWEEEPKADNESDYDYSGAVSISPPTGFSNVKKYLLMSNIITMILIVFVIKKLKCRRKK